MKTCTKCNRTLSLDSYYKNQSASDGRTARCKACTYKPRTPPLHCDTPCAHCGTLFASTHGTQYCSTDCKRLRANSVRRARYTSVRVPPTAEQLAERAERTRARDRAAYARRRAANPELFRNRDRKRKRARRRDPLLRLRDNIGSLIANKLSGQGYSKRSRTHDILGCSYEQFCSHIQSQFLPGMSWDARHLWHLDHRVPCALAATEEELLLLNRWDNFQPLWAKDNQSKFTTVDESDPVYLELLEMRMGKR